MTSFEYKSEGDLFDPALGSTYGSSVRIATTIGASIGYVHVSTEPGFMGESTYYSPNAARALAFALLDAAQIADIEAGTFDPDEDPFDDIDRERDPLVG